MATTEDIAAENILKRAELARISRQLKTRLSQTNLKAKLKERSSLSSSKSLQNLHRSLLPATQPTSASTSSPSLSKKRSLESLNDANKTEDESESPLKRSHLLVSQYPPSSPIYEDDSQMTFRPPKTPPQQKISLNTDIYNTVSTNKTQIHFSSPAQPVQPPSQATAQSLQKAVLSTPKQSRDEGADLLMFLATSPSPVQYKNSSNTNIIPSTPSRSLKSLTTAPSSAARNHHTGHTPLPLSQSNMMKTPGTPKNRFLKTPGGFNMNDYVNLFTPSPAIQRTPGDLSKDVNGKLIKF